MITSKTEKMITSFAKKYNQYQFESSSEMTPEFKSFASAFKKVIKAICNDHGIDSKSIKFSVGHFYISGFVKMPETAKTAYLYFSIPDVRSPLIYNESSVLLVRTAEHERDFKGGCNQYENNGLAFLSDMLERYSN